MMLPWRSVLQWASSTTVDSNTVPWFTASHGSGRSVAWRWSWISRLLGCDVAEPSPQAKGRSDVPAAIAHPRRRGHDRPRGFAIDPRALGPDTTARWQRPASFLPGLRGGAPDCPRSTHRHGPHRGAAPRWAVGAALSRRSGWSLDGHVGRGRDRVTGGPWSMAPADAARPRRAGSRSRRS